LRTPLPSKHGVRNSLPKMIPASVDSCPPLLSLASKVMVPMLTPMLKKKEVSTIYNLTVILIYKVLFYTI
jgi:hypothetical protein